MEYWREVPLGTATKAEAVELMRTDNVALYYSNEVICERGCVALTTSELFYEPPASRIRWSLDLDQIKQLAREPRGYLSSGKIVIELVATDVASTGCVLWQCQVCEELNESAAAPHCSSAAAAQTKCSVCGSLQRGELLIIPTAKCSSSLEATFWICEVCEESNASVHPSCPVCGFGRVSSVAAAPLMDPKVSATTASSRVVVYKLSFRSGGSGVFFTKLLSTLQESEAKEKGAIEPAIVVGLSGLMRHQAALNEATSASLSHAFSDLDALMQSAGGLVDLAAKISTKLRSAEASLNSKEQSTFQELIEALGLVHDASRPPNGAVADFYDELAGRLSIMVEALIARTGTRVFTLADVFCIYNRSSFIHQSSRLVAPADLLHAAKRLSVLKLPIRLHRFTAKGVLCLLPANDLGSQSATQMARLLAKHYPLTAVALAEEAKISIWLAGEQLRMAEEAGVLVRDGQRRDLAAYYENRF